MIGIVRVFAVLFFIGSVPFAAFADGLLASTGRLENANSPGTCSAALIAPDLVATAAHCANLEIINEQNAPSLFFRPSAPVGADRLAVVAAVHHPLYAPDLGEVGWRFPFDLAVLRLARPLAERAHPPLDVGLPPDVSENLTLVTWRSGADAPSVRECEVLSSPSLVVRLDCPVRGGDSGGAIVRQTETGSEIAAIMTSRLQFGDLDISQASHLDGRLAPMVRALEELEEGG